jgi:inner membrane protein
VDNLTHTLAGVMLSRAGLNRFAPRATLMLALAANVPDIDVVSWFGGPLTYLKYHRGWTHALALTPLLAVLPALLIWLIEKRRPRLATLWAVSLIATASHPLLDFTNIYGIRILLPFSGAWVRADTVSVIDLWIWAVLLLGLAAPALSRLVSSEIGARRTPGRGWAWTVLLLIAAYEYGRYLAHERAMMVLDSRVYAGEPPLRVAAFPGPANPLRWRGLVETEQAYLVFDLNLLSTFDPTDGRSYYKPPPGPAMQVASRTEPFRVFLDFSPYTLWRVMPPPEPNGTTTVEAYDLRFGDPSQPGFLAEAEIGPGMQVRRSQFTFGRIAPK